MKKTKSCFELILTLNFVFRILGVPYIIFSFWFCIYSQNLTILKELYYNQWHNHSHKIIISGIQDFMVVGLQTKMYFHCCKTAAKLAGVAGFPYLPFKKNYLKRLLISSDINQAQELIYCVECDENFNRSFRP